MSGSHSIGGGWSTTSAYGMNVSATMNSSGIFQASSSNSTFQVINEFKNLAARSIRQSTVILAIFNTIAAFAAALGIYYDCRQRALRNRTRAQPRVNPFTCVKGAETYPFLLSLAITVQGIVFAVAQSHGLDGLFASGCEIVSLFMLPGVFIVPYLQLIFGIETAIRGLRASPFPPRGKWTVTICMAAWSLFLLITGLVAFFIPSSDFCFASLFWLVAKWAEGAFALFLAMSIFLGASAIIIFLKLTRHTTVETSERVQASRMVYYIVVALLSNVLITPFFVYLTFDNLGDTDGNTGLTLSMIATIVANVSGLMNGGLHLFFRSNIISTIAPKDKMAEYERQQLKYKIRKADPGEYDFSAHVLQPVGGPRPVERTGTGFLPTESQETLVRYGKDYESSIESAPPRPYVYPPNPLKSNSVFPATSMPRAPEPAQLQEPQTPAPSKGGFPQRKPSMSYSLFPNNNDASNTVSVTILPPTTYSPKEQAHQFNFETLPPPPSFKSRHRRESSAASSATVQIGLRFSNVEDMPAMASTMIKNAQKVHNLNCPKEIKPSPLASSAAADESAIDDDEPASPLGPYVPDDADEVMTLSSAVYVPESPIKKTPSPRGVGFDIPQRSNTTTGVQGRPPRSPPPPVARSRGNSDAVQARGDWI